MYKAGQIITVEGKKYRFVRVKRLYVCTECGKRPCGTKLWAMCMNAAPYLYPKLIEPKKHMG